MLELLRELPWPALRPADHLLFEQPGWSAPEKYCKVAATADRTTIVAYKPDGGRIKLSAGALDPNHRALWADPRTARMYECRLDCGSGVYEAETPTAQDWVLILRRER